MKIKQIILSLGLLVAGGMMLSSCTKNDENTIALIGTESYIDDILSVIPDSLQTRFFAEFGSKRRTAAFFITDNSNIGHFDPPFINGFNVKMI